MRLVGLALSSSKGMSACHLDWPCNPFLCYARMASLG